MRLSRRTSLRNTRRGFVLVMVLVLIALAGALLARLSLRSLSWVDRATAVQEQLQRHWGCVSCRLATLSRAEELLAGEESLAREAGQGWPYAGTLTYDVQLAGAHYHLVLDDEDAKANLNTIDREAPDRVLTTLIQRRGISDVLLPVLLRPLVPASDGTAVRPYRSWGQIYDFTRIDGSASEISASIPPELTVWGNGRLNLARASDAAVEALLTTRLPPPQVAQLLDLRRGWASDLATLLDSPDLKLTRRQRVLLRGLVAEESASYSLSVVMRDSAERESWSLYVRDPSDRLAQAVQTFVW